MKRLQILIDEDLDAELERTAEREGRSKGSLVREYVRQQLKPLPPIEQDPIWELAGRWSIGQNSSQEIDDIVYGPLTERASRRRKRG